MTDNNNNHKLLLDGTITACDKKDVDWSFGFHSNNKSFKILIHSDICSQRVLYTFIIIVIITIIIILRHVHRRCHTISPLKFNIIITTLEERGTGISNYSAVLHVYMYVRCWLLLFRHGSVKGRMLKMT